MNRMNNILKTHNKYIKKSFLVMIREKNEKFLLIRLKATKTVPNPNPVTKSKIRFVDCDIWPRRSSNGD